MAAGNLLPSGSGGAIAAGLTPFVSPGVSTNVAVSGVLATHVVVATFKNSAVNTHSLNAYCYNGGITFYFYGAFSCEINYLVMEAP